MLVMNLSILSYCLLVFGLGQSVANGDLEDILAEVFNPKNESTHATNYNSNKSTDCECVPYYSCADSTLNIRTTDKCDDYLYVCCEPDNPVNNNGQQNRTCGQRNPEGVGFRITGDDDHAQYGEFPWMTALLGRASTEEKLNEPWSYKCGASLIHPQVVLTAAHCISDTKLYKIRAGEWDAQTENEIYPHQERNVKTIILHPEYNKKLLFHDYALLILDSPVKIEENVDIVCLPTKDEIIDNLVCYSNGWGKDNYGRESTRKDEALLRKVHVPIVDTDSCQASLRTTRLGTHFNLHESFICAGCLPDQDTCREDGGSPLVCPIRGKQNTYFQVGVVSWGIDCGGLPRPRVYANVAKVVDWIDKTMTNNGFETSTYKY